MRIHVAVISGNNIHRDRASYILEEYIDDRRLDVHLEYFSSGLSLLEEIERIGDYDLYICDVALPDMSGITLAESMRRSGMRYRMLYINGDGLSAVKAFKVRAVNHLTKPLNQRELAEALDEEIEHLERAEISPIIELKIKKGLMRVPVDDICYVDIIDRALCYHFKNGDCEISALLREPFREAISALAEQPMFYCAGASFAINLSQIYIAGNNYFSLRNGEIVCPPKSLCGKITDEWRKFSENLR